MYRVVFAVGLLWAQVEFYVQNDIVYISPNDTLAVVGSPVGDSYLDNNASVENDGGVFWLTGNWTNASGGTGFVPARNGWLYMVGGYQRFEGPSDTRYNNLSLFNGAIKEMIGANGTLEGILELRDCELRTNTNLFTVENTNPGAITRTTGFVSSLGQGRLIRYTQANTAYLFPVGDRQIGPFRYRPVEVTPSSANPHIYRVRFVNQDPTIDGWDRTRVEAPIQEANEFFYHITERSQGNEPITLRIYYDEANDTYKDTLAHWEDDVNAWQALPTTINRTAGPPLTTITQTAYMETANLDNFTSPNFALARIQTRIKIYVPTVFSPNGDGSNDEWLVYYEGFTRIEFRIYDRWGLLIYKGEQGPEGPLRWNGKTQEGREVPEDAYVFVIKGYFSNGNYTERAGTVTVVR
ncbi:MAG: T9SS type B sorting domain-containing protein [Bacteroidia bacterium]